MVPVNPSSNGKEAGSLSCPQPRAAPKCFTWGLSAVGIETLAEPIRIERIEYLGAMDGLRAPAYGPRGFRGWG